jgi:condensin complex subunit 3
MKASGYDPLKLLSKMNVMEFDAQCEMMLKTIVSATPEDLNALSAPEIEAYRDGVKRSIVAISGEKQDISVESLFFARVFCHQMKQGSKSTILGNIGQVGATILPDIMVVCDILERTVDKLMGAIEAQDDEMQDNLASMCQQLLQLTSVVELEEGSRRHLIIVMKRMLSSILTPDDLVEDAVKVLSTLTDRDDVVEHILEVLNEIERLSGVVGDELEENHVLRTLAIISVFLEIAPSRLTSCPQMSEIPKFVLPLVTHEKQLVREAAVSSLGKLGLFTVQDMVAETFKPLLLQITANEDESIETRAQALIALADWSMLNGEMISPCVVDQENLSVHGCVEAWFESSEPFLVCVAAEVASKLLYAGKLCDHEWLAQLVSVYFDEQFTSSAADEEEEDVKEIGSLVRLQQMLSVFFPVFCIKSKVGRDQFLQSIEPMLKIVCLKPTKNQKSRGSKAFPVDKMIAFVCDSVRRGDDVAEKAEEEARTQGGESNNTVVDAAPEASIELHVAIQLARFLANNHSAVTITSQRNLFKILAKIDLTPGIHDEPRSDLLTLKELTERLSMAIDDSSCVAALELMEDVLELAKVQSEDEESVSPDSDDETTDSHDDTPEATGSTLSKSFDRITLDGGSAHVDKENLTRDSFSCRDSLSMKEKSPEPSVSTKRRTGLRQGST